MPAKDDRKLYVLLAVTIILAAYASYRIIGDAVVDREQAAFQAGLDEGIRQAVGTIFGNIQSSGFVALTLNNQSLVLVPSQTTSTP